MHMPSTKIIVVGQHHYYNIYRYRVMLQQEKRDGIVAISAVNTMLSLAEIVAVITTRTRKMVVLVSSIGL